ncbi:hypothetical protein XA68_10908 [Ophiocordyceps unilateralis]|uniref:Mitochondrial export translocase Oxa2 n=1 Tax=Ophiocordyceps unilateralis TaxID=268505 RepID=A0A2A9PGY9_OPHUN|nr:hypothetical protein XA68_10908 [Ophiocordyceps unilateralis]
MRPPHRTLTGLYPLARVRARQPSIRTQTDGRRHSHFGLVIASTADAISSLHAIGLPWYLVIPLVAAGVNFSIRLPIHLYVSNLNRTRRELRPLLAAWHARHMGSGTQGLEAVAAPNFESRVAALNKKSRDRIFKEWRVQQWKSFMPILSVGPFLVVSQALRALCGAPSMASSDIDTASGLFHQSLADGGCLWFVDLTAQDPYYALPLLCTALIAKNIWGRLSKDDFREVFALNDTRPKSPMHRLKLGVTRIMLFFPLVAAASAYLPSAVFLYWTTTFGLGSVNSAIATWRAPKIEAGSEISLPQKPPRIHANLPYLRGPDTGSRRELKSSAAS